MTSASARRVFRHTAIQLAGKVVSTGLGLVAVGVMTRSLGPHDFGAYTTVTAYLGVFAVLVDFGISTTLVAMLSERGADEERLAANALGLRLVTTACAMAVAAILALATPYSDEIRGGIAILAVSFVFVAAQQIQVAVFQRHVRMDRPTIAEAVGRLILVLGVSLAAWRGAGIVGTLLAVIAANAAQALLAAVLLTGVAPMRPAFDLAVWRVILRRAWPVGVSIALNLIYLRADTVILSLTRTQTEVGIYGAAYKVIDVLTVLPMLFMGIVLPFLASSWSAGDRPRFVRVLNRALDALALAAAPLVAGALLLGPGILMFVAGAEFRPSGDVLRVLIFGVAAIFTAAAFTHAIVAADAQRRMLAPLAADAVVSFALYAALVPRYGIPAAAGVTVFSELFAAAAAVTVALRATEARLSVRVPLRAVLAAALMPIPDLLLWHGLPVLARVALDATVYALATLATGAVRPALVREFLALRRGR